MYATPASIQELNKLLLSAGLQLEVPLKPSTETALSLLLTELGIDSLDALIALLQGQEKAKLFERLTQALTNSRRPFFKDYKNFKFIRKAILPYFAKQDRTSPLKILVLGDGIDTDVYSFSILANESAWGERELKVVGYDISSIKAATYQNGIYGSQMVAASIPAAFVGAHFDEFQNGWRLKARHRDRCSFKQTRPELPWPDKESFDVIFLRNAMTYLPPSAQAEVLEEMKQHLVPGSFVIATGSSAVLDASSEFKATKVESIRCFRYRVSASKSATGAASQDFKIASSKSAPPKAKPTHQSAFSLDLANLARKIYLFDRMPPAELDDICDRVKLCSFTPGEVILAQGEKGDAFFLLKSGKVRVEIAQGKLKKPLKVAELERGQIFGEMSLILDEPCSASVVSETDVEAYLFDQNLFEYLCFENDLFAEKLDEIILERRADTASKKEEERTRLVKEQLSIQTTPGKTSSRRARTLQLPMTDDRFSELVRHVRDVKLFRNLTGRDMELVSSRVTCWNYPSGNRLITQGHKGSAFYILNKGRVRVEIKQGFFSKNKVVATLETGQLFGEISLILDQNCTANVVADEDVEAFVFNRELFKFLIENNAPFRRTIEDIAIERRADTAKKR